LLSLETTVLERAARLEKVSTQVLACHTVQMYTLVTNMIFLFSLHLMAWVGKNGPHSQSFIYYWTKRCTYSHHTACTCCWVYSILVWGLSIHSLSDLTLSAVTFPHLFNDPITIPFPNHHHHAVLPRQHLGYSCFSSLFQK